MKNDSRTNRSDFGGGSRIPNLQPHNAFITCKMAALQQYKTNASAEVCAVRLLVAISIFLPLPLLSNKFKNRYVYITIL